VAAEKHEKYRSRLKRNGLWEAARVESDHSNMSRLTIITHENIIQLEVQVGSSMLLHVHNDGNKVTSGLQQGQSSK
jgi:hypothetical protein